MLMATRASVTIIPKNPHKRFGRVISRFVNDLNNSSKKISQTGLAKIKEATPVKSGKTQSLWNSKVNKTSNGSFKINFNNPSRVIVFLNKGTGPSVGKYIPAINRRLSYGIHPGSTIHQGFLDKTVSEIKDVSLYNLRNVIRSVKRNVNKSFRA